MTDAALDQFDRLPERERALRRGRVRVLILTGLGLNCEAETEGACRCGPGVAMDEWRESALR